MNARSAGKLLFVLMAVLLAAFPAAAQGGEGAWGVSHIRPLPGDLRPDNAGPDAYTMIGFAPAPATMALVPSHLRPADSGPDAYNVGGFAPIPATIALVPSHLRPADAGPKAFTIIGFSPSAAGF